MSVFDRTKWPPPEDNPIIQLLACEDEWLPNPSVAAALGYKMTKGRLAGGHWILTDPAMQQHMRLARYQTEDRKGYPKLIGREMRFFSKTGIAILALRGRTPECAAFQAWVAECVGREFDNGNA